MASLPVRRTSCLLRLRDNCPFRKLRRRTYDVSAAASSPIGPYWNNTGNHPINSEPLPPVCCPDQSEAAADIPIEEDPPAAENQQNQQNPENRADDWMDLDADVDPETGERAQG
ncbi:uncharacterized protein ABDE67_005602 [Symphorus nematophorus]